MIQSFTGHPHVTWTLLAAEKFGKSNCFHSLWYRGKEEGSWMYQLTQLNYSAILLKKFTFMSEGTQN